jgi:SAM-dependent methyltransferase
VAGPIYDRIGKGYGVAREEDPRIAAAIGRGLGDARSVVNVGAGTGSYEPADREVTAVEPSAVMIAQRPAGSMPVLQASADALPLTDDGVDAAMAIVSDHHWEDRAAGMREMRRVARERVVIVNVDPASITDFWLTRDYLPGFAKLVPERYLEPGYWEAELRELLGEVEIEPIPLAADCRDGLCVAWWRRPEAYLDQTVRSGISVFHLVPEEEVREALGGCGATSPTAAGRAATPTCVGAPGWTFLARRRDGSAELGRGGVRLRRLGRGRLRRLPVVGHVDEVGGDIVAQQTARAELDVGEAGRVEPASASFAEVDGRLRSEPPQPGRTSLPLQHPRLDADKATMFEQQDYSRRRVERAAFETDRLLVVGDVTLPPEGYQSRFSDSLNRAELEFLPLTNCEVTTLVDGQQSRQDFMALSKRHIRVAYPVEPATGAPPAGEAEPPMRES